MAGLVIGDCLEILKTKENNHFDSLVTDPPAGISFMNKEWDGDKGGREGWINWMTEVMRECLRVMKPGAHGLVWAIPRTSHWTATALENAGFEIRDVVTHLFGSGFPKSLNISKAIDRAAGAEREVIGPSKRHAGISKKTDTIGDLARFGDSGNFLTAPSTDEAKQWEGFGTALKPASEHWILIRKPLSEKTIAKNVLKWGVGGININASRVAGHNPALGRFPANLVLSHADECEDDICSLFCAVRRLDRQSGILSKPGNKPGNITKRSIGKNVKFNAESNYVDGSAFQFGDSGGASRFFYVAKASKKDRNAGLHGMDVNSHPTVKSSKLMEYLITLVTPKGGKVLDPFMGSGSTGVGAMRLNFDFHGIEQNKEYFEIANKRINKSQADLI